MGAVCSIYYAEAHPNSVNGLVLDSPFRSLSTVVDRIAERQVSLPKFILKPAMYFVKEKAVEESKC